jgi:hypothetical protein
MENKTSIMQQFEQFATDRINNHKAELNTRYENEAIDKQTLDKAHREHKEIFSQKLDDKIKKLFLGDHDRRLQTELQNKKHNYMDQLISNPNKS